MSDLVGYMRKSESGKALKMVIGVEAFLEAERFEGEDGYEYVELIMKSERVKDIIAGEKEVTSVVRRN